MVRCAVAQENRLTSVGRFGTFVHYSYAPDCSLAIQTQVQQLADRQAFALRRASVGIFCTQQDKSAQKYSPSGTARRREIAIIAYTVDDFHPVTPRILQKNVRHHVQYVKRKIDPNENTTATWVYDELNRSTSYLEAATLSSMNLRYCRSSSL